MDENILGGIAGSRWKGLLAEWRSSGLTIRSFCLRNRLHDGTFYRWKRVLAKDGTKNLVSRQAYVPVVVQAKGSLSAESPIEIGFPGRTILRVRSGCDQRLLGDLITLLEGKPC